MQGTRSWEEDDQFEREPDVQTWEREEGLSWRDFNDELDAMCGYPVDLHVYTDPDFQTLATKVRGLLQLADAYEPRGHAYLVEGIGLARFEISECTFKSANGCPGFVQADLDDRRIEVGRVSVRYYRQQIS
jgi:hypothetical protein